MLYVAAGIMAARPMYVPKMFLIAVACFIVWRILSRILNCENRIGRNLALSNMTVGCRKREDGGVWSCDVCSLYGGTATILFGGAALVFAAIAIWQWFKS
jgi:hypothetical protein